MAQELVYTSVPRGIRPGSSGFCTAGHTANMNVALISLLESLSSYQPYYPHYTPQAVNNPVAYSHLFCNIAGKNIHILSRICFSGMDYTGRSNFLAHHISLDENEIASVSAGPASLTNFFRTQWNEAPQFFPEPLTVFPQDRPLSRAVTWECYTGDAGWAGVLAEQFMYDPAGTVYIVYDPQQHPDILTLVDEALMLLPEDLRWQVTYNTFFNAPAVGTSCNWRFCTAGNSFLQDAVNRKNAMVIDLTAPLPEAAGELAQIARTGTLPVLNVADSEEVYQEETIKTGLPFAAVPDMFHNYNKPAVPVPERNDNRNRKLLLIIAIAVLLAAVSGGVITALYLAENNSGSVSYNSSKSDRDDAPEKAVQLADAGKKDTPEASGTPVDPLQGKITLPEEFFKLGNINAPLNKDRSCTFSFPLLPEFGEISGVWITYKKELKFLSFDPQGATPALDKKRPGVEALALKFIRKDKNSVTLQWNDGILHSGTKIEALVTDKKWLIPCTALQLTKSLSPDGSAEYSPRPDWFPLQKCEEDLKKLKGKSQKIWINSSDGDKIVIGSVNVINAGKEKKAAPADDKIKDKRNKNTNKVIRKNISAPADGEKKSPAKDQKNLKISKKEISL